jgi:uncharacterized protein (TIGR03067 family)
MRRLFLLFAVLFVVPLSGSDSPKEYDDRTETIGIEGTWRLTEVEYGGQKRKTDLPKAMLTYRSGTYTANYTGGDTFRGSYRIAPTRKPSHLDQLPSNGSDQGQTIKFIYQIDGDTLRIARIMSAFTTSRPQGFDDDHIFVVTYKRVK